MTAIIGIDTETTPFIEGMTTELKLWCAYGEKYKKVKRKHKITKRYRTYYDLVECKEHGTTKLSFYLFIAKRLREIRQTRQHYIITAFNLSFDLYNLIDDIQTLPYIVEEKIIQNTDSKPSFMIIPVEIFKRKNGDIETKKLYFIDLGNYTGTQWNLKGIAKAFNLPEKLHEELQIDFNTMPRDYEVTNDIIDYCYRDSEIVYKALKEINPISNGRVRVSASSLAFADIKERSGWKYFHRPFWVVDAERASYYGGRVEVNPMFRGKETKAIKYDVNSMYPHVMYDMKVPIRFIDKLTRFNDSYTDLDVIDLIEYIYESNDLTANIKANIRMYKNSLPYKDKDNRLTFTATHEYISGYWTIEEFFPAVRDLEIKIESIAAIYLYEAKKGMFNNFIDYWYDIKKNSTNAIQRFRSKLMLNSAYGKYGQREIRQVDLLNELPNEELEAIKIIMTGEKFAEYASENKEGETVLYNLQNLGGIITCTTKLNQEAPYKSTIVASLITARARRKLWEVMKKIDWAYADTDSITIPHYVLESIDINELLELNDELGGWSKEVCCDKDCQTFTFWNKKDYRCLNAFKLKGIPNYLITPEQYDKGEFEEFNRIVKPKEAHIRGLPAYSIVKGKKKFKR